MQGSTIKCNNRSKQYHKVTSKWWVDIYKQSRKFFNNAVTYYDRKITGSWENGRDWKFPGGFIRPPPIQLCPLSTSHCQRGAVRPSICFLIYNGRGWHRWTRRGEWWLLMETETWSCKLEVIFAQFSKSHWTLAMREDGSTTKYPGGWRDPWKMLHLVRRLWTRFGSQIYILVLYLIIMFKTVLSICSFIFRWDIPSGEGCCWRDTKNYSNSV